MIQVKTDAEIRSEIPKRAPHWAARFGDCVELPDGPVNPASLQWENRDGYVVVRHPQRKLGRRVLFVNRYGGSETFLSWTQSRFLGHHLWGCLELAYAGYEILLPRDLPRMGRWGSHVFSDWKIPGINELGTNDIIFCAHNVLLWNPLLKTLGRRGPRLVGLLYAKEPLPLGNEYTAIAGLTNVAVRHAARFARPKRQWLGWAIEFSDLFQAHPYDPKWGLSCGLTLRDFGIVAKAFEGSSHQLKLCCKASSVPSMPATVSTTGHIAYEQLFGELYRHAAYVLVTLKRDDHQRSAVGYTNVLEAMAVGRPIIKTRTGAVDGDIDIEAEGIGLYFEPGDAAGLRRATQYIIDHPHEAAEMGKRARRLCEERYSTQRFATDLHELFQSI